MFTTGSTDTIIKQGGASSRKPFLTSSPAALATPRYIQNHFFVVNKKHVNVITG